MGLFIDSTAKFAAARARSRGPAAAVIVSKNASLAAFPGGRSRRWPQALQ